MHSTFASPLACLALLATPALAQRELPSILAPASEAGEFGWALDVHGPWLVVGSPIGQGRVHVYDSQTGDWLRTLPTMATDFGKAVAVDGDLALVGRPQSDHGAASLFDLTTGDQLWTKSSNAEDFGHAVALGGGRALVGAPRQAGDRGRVYVLDPATGDVLSMLAASDATPGARFGASIAIDGDLALVGSSQAGAAGGNAYVFDLATGVEVARLTTATAYGAGVAIDGPRLVVAALEAGVEHALHVFDGGTFQEVAKYDVGNAHSNQFRLADARDGLALVSTDEGSAHDRVVYVVDLLTGALVQQLVPAGAQNVSEFGASAALGVGGSSYVGDTAGDGRVRRYTTDAPIGVTYCSPAEQHSGGEAGELHVWGSDVLADDDLMLRADRIKIAAWGYLLASRTQGFVSHPGNSDGNLCLGGAIGRFVSQTANSKSWSVIAMWVDLQALPDPLGALLPGDSLHFQMWFRDGTHSNFTDAVTVTFQ